MIEKWTVKIFSVSFVRSFKNRRKIHASGLEYPLNESDDLV